jgi:hypothetical protein
LKKSVRVLRTFPHGFTSENLQCCFWGKGKHNARNGNSHAGS